MSSLSRARPKLMFAILWNRFLAYGLFLVLLSLPGVFFLWRFFWLSSIWQSSTKLGLCWGDLLHTAGIAFLSAFLLGILGYCLSGLSLAHFEGVVFHWVRQVLRPLVFGASTGLFVISIYYYLAERMNGGSVCYDTIMATSVCLYVSFCAIFVGFHGVFFEKMPLLDIESLMEEMADDIKFCRKSIFWSFPGLSFGSVSVGGELYKKLHAQLREHIGSEKFDTEILVLSPIEIVEFYSPYFEDCGLNDTNINHISTILKERHAAYALSHSKNGVDAIEKSALEKMKTELDTLKLDKTARSKAENTYNAVVDSHDMYEAARSSPLMRNQRHEVPPNFRHQVIIIDRNIYFRKTLAV